MRNFFRDAGNIVEPVSEDNGPYIKTYSVTDTTIDLAPLLQSALDAERIGHWDQSIIIWSQLKETSLNKRLVAVGLGRSLRSSGALMEADDVFVEALKAQPDDLELLAEYALVAKMRNDDAECARRGHTLITLNPEDILFVGEAALAFLKVGRAQFGADILAKADQINPRNVQILIPKAVIAQHLEDWAEAARCWGIAHSLLPNDLSISDQYAKALWNATFEEGDTGIAADHGTPPQREERLAMADLASLFESLGDNCELGLVQRLLGAEPVSLYRFAAVRPALMLDLLKKRFEPLGDPSHTKIDDKDDEYIAYDDRGYFWLHTMVYKTDMLSEKQLKQQTARITILRKKLLANLSSNSRIFVFKDSEAAISDAILLRLSAALRRYANNLVLGIRLSDDHHPSGSIRHLTEHVIIGYIDRMFVGNTNRETLGTDVHHPDHIDLSGWSSILEKAFDYAVKTGQLVV